MSKALTSYTIERYFDHPCEAVYDAFANAEKVAKWMFGKEAKNVAARVDPRVGGEFFIESDAFSNERSEWGERWGVKGLVVAAEPNKRFAFSQHWYAPVGYNQHGKDPIDELIDIELSATVHGCHFLYTHHGIPDDGLSAYYHKLSVEYTIADLGRLLAGELD